MRSLSKILLPVDFSQRSLSAAQYIRRLAAQCHSDLLLLHVLMPPQNQFSGLGGSMLADLYKGRLERAAAELEPFAAADLAGITVRRLVREGDPAREIVRCAQEEAADLILMPTHGYGPFRPYILGSNTAKVLHDADCPVWTGVHLEDAPAHPAAAMGEVLCALDLGPQSGKALGWADWLRQEVSGRLTVIHVVPQYSAAGSGFADSAREELLRLCPGLDSTAELLIEAGEPANAICSAAARLGAGVLVIGRGSAAGVFGRLRTNAYAIIRQSPCPVVSV